MKVYILAIDLDVDYNQYAFDNIKDLLDAIEIELKENIGEDDFISINIEEMSKEEFELLREA